MTHVLDKKSKIFLKFLESQPDKEISYIDEPEFPEKLGSQEDLFVLINYLEDEGYVECVRSVHGTPMGVHLSHKGRNRGDFAFRSFLHYVSEKWIDFLALTVATIALVVSIIALTAQH